MKLTPLALLALAFLPACASRPIVPAGNNAEAFAAALKGKLYEFSPAALLPKANSDAADPVYGYEGLALAMEPVAAHCQTAGGQLRAVEHDASGARRLPVLLACDGRQAAMWYFRLSYAQSPGGGRGVYVRILDARVLDENQLQEARRVAEDRRRRDEESRARARTQREAAIKAAVEREAQEREARQQQLAAFQANLKQGARIRWLLRAPGDYAVGMVVRIEGELVFVQFNNAVVSGSSTRYVRRSELEPWNGVPTGVTYNTP